MVIIGSMILLLFFSIFCAIFCGFGRVYLGLQDFFWVTFLGILGELFLGLPVGFFLCSFFFFGKISRCFWVFWMIE